MSAWMIDDSDWVEEWEEQGEEMSLFARRWTMDSPQSKQRDVEKEHLGGWFRVGKDSLNRRPAGDSKDQVIAEAGGKASKGQEGYTIV